MLHHIITNLQKVGNDMVPDTLNDHGRKGNVLLSYLSSCSVISTVELSQIH
jgi:hypothetical protein